MVHFQKIFSKIFVHLFLIEKVLEKILEDSCVSLSNFINEIPKLISLKCASNYYN